jgi:hypothetical protein
MDEVGKRGRKCWLTIRESRAWIAGHQWDYRGSVSWARERQRIRSWYRDQQTPFWVCQAFLMQGFFLGFSVLMHGPLYENDGIPTGDGIWVVFNKSLFKWSALTTGLDWTSYMRKQSKEYFIQYVTYFERIIIPQIRIRWKGCAESTFDSPSPPRS